MTASRSKYAAVLAGAAGLALIVAGWWIVGWEYRGDWGRLTDVSWWVGGLLRGLGWLWLGKAGFKIALAGIAGTVALVAWVRRSRRARTQPQESGEG
ncbi:hypothetical protein [Cryptosporangium aurantiacum]|uniref:Uncharacterized protein n=1 Tax=Cryptosporangium aurantiacum TaxID=134849 RepID=A0A1M7RGA2_9ACTN|nr:hypothetical protein [Cryptosporangium aurantiacum]SHN45192.1 hypothetical protein SAMN05443668_111185 [Cryptosporangium aurantiacum]